MQSDTASLSPSAASRALAYLQLMRPANIVTAVADILAGFAVSGAAVQIIDAGNGWFYIPEINNLALLVLSTVGLYGGGVVLNDFFDAELDKTERPERPIPSGRASKTGTLLLGMILLTIGIQSAVFVSLPSSAIAIAIALLAVMYDAYGKHHPLLGPLNMGLCRGANLLLGISISTAALGDLWFIAVIPVIYIAAVTTVSRGEVHGSDGNALQFAGWLYAFVIVLIAGLAFHPYFQLRPALPFLVLFGGLIFRALFQAHATRKPQDIGKAVKYGVLALILMDAAIAAGFAGGDYALLIVLLLPVSIGLAKMFAVT